MTPHSESGMTSGAGREISRPAPSFWLMPSPVTLRQKAARYRRVTAWPRVTAALGRTWRPPRRLLCRRPAAQLRRECPRVPQALFHRAGSAFLPAQIPLKNGEPLCCQCVLIHARNLPNKGMTIFCLAGRFVCRCLQELKKQSDFSMGVCCWGSY